jgi:hypothetical protein
LALAVAAAGRAAACLDPAPEAGLAPAPLDLEKVDFLRGRIRVLQ